MMHLSYDELFELAEAASGDEGFDDVQIEQLEHLKECTECYESFCLLCTLSEVMSEAGSYYLAYDTLFDLQEAVDIAKTKVLAKIRLVRDNVANAVGAVMEQIEQASAYMHFGPSLAAATRGTDKSDSQAIKLEEFESDKTFIVFKPQSNELMLQINTRAMEDKVLHAYLVFENLPRVEIPLEKKGKIVKGFMDNISDCNFDIVIEMEN